MKTIELRKKLIDEIRSSDNKHLLEEMYYFLSSENKINEVYKLSYEQKAAIHEAREQIKNGDYLTDEEADKDIDRWVATIQTTAL